MSHQLTFADSEFSIKRRQTRKEIFLSRMEQILPWQNMTAVIEGKKIGPDPRNFNQRVSLGRNDLLIRTFPNVPAQHAIQTALGGYQSISEFITPGGRLYEQRNRAWELINDIPGVSCVKPRGALYMFPKIDAKRFNIHDDQKMVLDFLLQEKVLLVQGTAFNWPWPDHFRIVTLPRVDDIELSLSKFARFLSGYHQL